MNNNKVAKKTVDEILFEGLNEHGFIFQEKVAEIIESTSSRTNWQVVNKEYPIYVNDKETRVDIVLRETSNSRNKILGIVECKRVNPDRSFWLFGNPSSENSSQPYLLHLKAGYIYGHNSINYNQAKLPFDDVSTSLVENWWLEISKNNNGPKGFSSSPDPIEKAFYQVFSGVSGIVLEQEEECKRDPQDVSTYYVPIIVTTAPLYIASYQLNDVDLFTGKIDRAKIHFGPQGQESKSREWVMVNYGWSKSLPPKFRNENVSGISPVELAEFHKRTIFIVNSSYIVKFLSGLHVVT
jgi:hypothetical protein